MMRFAAISSLLAVALTSCSSVMPADGGPQVAGDGSCHADRVAWAVGKPGDEDTIKRVWKESGAGLLRPIGPGEAVTRDFRADRINVYLDANNIVTQLNCG
ncbi:I78 family peptidase inhibitor [Luteimonas sp. SX5]|uniref:I78 family peptidase inhibitor n=1 Tax=Luteimonas galliterrae TaxID=2940486 RepID=A0ABT0MI26_9GAMM|nr:I78 family peptidase inhibitor [Luteimonas galliterrae]MCL1634524.1 I78 family peptidase inhibitor [Luteimonas galliterrae]